MDRISIYCEDGSMNKFVRALKKDKRLNLISFPFENTNRRISKSKKPSGLTCDTEFTTADSDMLISDTLHSDIYESIKQIIGVEHMNDIRHIDTAFKENCKLFITPDKDDIVNNGKALEELTGIKFFYCEDYELIGSYISTLIGEMPN